MKNTRLAMKVYQLNAREKPRHTPLFPRDAKWPARLAKPTDPREMLLAARAQSILHGDVRDASGLTTKQAVDVIAWHERHLQTIFPKRRFWLFRLFGRSCT